MSLSSSSRLAATFALLSASSRLAATFALLSATSSLALTCAPITPPLGCFDDGRGARALPNKVFSSLSLTVGACATACGNAGFELAGLTGHATPAPADWSCYCGSSIAAGAAPAPARDCNAPCPGGGVGPCGANMRLSVYNFTCDGPRPPPPGPPLDGIACSQPESRAWAFCNKSLTFEARVADLVSRLTLEEMGPQLTARQAPAIPRLGVPAFYFGLNFIHGITNPVTGGVLCIDDKCPTIWPAGGAQGASWNESGWRALGHFGAMEMRALNNLQWGPVARPGVGMDALTSWGPTINLQRDPRWGRNQETPSSDPFVLSRYAVAVARGMQEGEDSRYVMVATTFKHFAAYSIEDIHAANGTHITRENFNAVVSDYDLYDTYFPHFRAAVMPVAQGGGAGIGVMMAMNSINGIPCTASHFLIQETLFDKWGMQGYITSDGGNMITDMVTPWPSGHGWCPFHAPPCSVDEAVALSSAARCAVADGNEYHDHTVSSVSAGLSKLADIKALLTDTFMMRMRLGLFDNVSAADSPYFAYGLDELASPGAAEANAIAAREGLVLLARGTVSGGAPALPFARGGGGETAVIGFAANNTGKFLGNYVSQICSKGGDTCFPSLLESIGALGEAVTFARGCSDARTCADVDVAAAAAAARGAARVVLTLGLDQTLEAEQRDRANVTLPPAQQALFAAVAAAAAGKPFVVVLIHGGAVAVPEVKASSAGIVDAFYPGTQGGPAIAEVLFGIYNPAGKLPVDVYDASYQGVDFLDMSVASLGRTYRYFRGPNTPGGAPLWPFGFGLSYTTFSLRWTSGQPAPLVITPSSPLVTLSVTVTNTGARVGDEVVQLYLVPRASSLSPAPPFVPTRVLVAFARVGGLAPLEARDVPLTIDPREAFMLTSDAAGTRGLVAGEYTLAVSRGVAGDELLALATVA